MQNFLDVITDRTMHFGQFYVKIDVQKNQLLKNHFVICTATDVFCTRFDEINQRLAPFFLSNGSF